jgi:hypothetical protein
VGAGGNVKQALGLIQDDPTTFRVDVIAGDHSEENVTVFVHTLTMTGGSINSVQMMSGGQFIWKGGQVLGVATTGLSAVNGTISISGFNLQTAASSANCGALPEAAWSTAPAQVTNAAGCFRGTLLDNSAVITGFSTNGTILFTQETAYRARPRSARPRQVSRRRR